jgi:amino acid permease
MDYGTAYGDYLCNMADYKSKRTVSPKVIRDPEIGSGSSDVRENADAMVDKPEAKLHRKLRSRHVSMIAIGGAIGTGLIIATCVSHL